MQKNPAGSENFQTIVFEAPIGEIQLRARDGLLWELSIDSGSQVSDAQLNRQAENHGQEAEQENLAVLERARIQLEEYFGGARKTFDLPLALQGTKFQRQVWDRLAAIPFGSSSSYGAIAREIGLARAARAVGGAVGANPIPIIVGCHRILASNLALTGYSGGGGLTTKQWLLKHEGISWNN